jgi:hypothetical protein
MPTRRPAETTPDLFSALPTVTAAGPSAVPKGKAGQNSPASQQRHFLPEDLAGALKRLDDVEIDALLAAVTAEAQRRGRRPPSPSKEKPVSDSKPQRRQEAAEDGTVSLTIGKLNAVRAAFKAGVKPSSIARQFGISQSDVRKASVTISSDLTSPLISMASLAIGGLDLGRVNSTSTPHTCAAAPSPIAASVPAVMRDIRLYRVCHARTRRPQAAIAVCKCRFHATIVAQCLQQSRPRGRDSLRPFAGRLHGVPQSLVKGAPHRRAAR